MSGLIDDFPVVINIPVAWGEGENKKILVPEELKQQILDIEKQ